MSGFADTLEDALARPDARSMVGRRALVAGGGLSGTHGSVGFATAWSLAREGAAVVVVDRDSDAANRAIDLIREEGGTATALQADLTHDAECARAVVAAAEVLGGLDALVTTIGRGDIDGILDVERDQWDGILAVNLTTAWQLIRHAADVLAPGSTIVTTSSGAAGSRGPGMPYSIAKAALEQLTVGAAATLAPRRIRVNGVRVGTIWSTFASRTFSAEQREQRRGAVALGTEGSVWDIAAANVFLSGDRSRWITGQILAVDGGGPTPAPPGHRSARGAVR